MPYQETSKGPSEDDGALQNWPAKDGSAAHNVHTVAKDGSAAHNVHTVAKDGSAAHNVRTVAKDGSAVPNAHVAANDAVALVRRPPNDVEVHIPALSRVALLAR
jgi:hypothetical protein